MALHLQIFSFVIPLRSVVFTLIYVPTAIRWKPIIKTIKYDYKLSRYNDLDVYLTLLVPTYLFKLAIF